MAGWAGFTDDDLRRMKQGSSGETATQRQAQLKRQRAPNRDRLAAGPRTQGGAAQTNSHLSLDPSQRLSHPEEPKVKANGTRSGGNAARGENPVPLPDNKDGVRREDKVDKMSSDKRKPSTGQESKTSIQEEEQTRELDEKEVLRVEMDNVVKFQKQQKMIEEANKQKREYLSKAINERKKKAKAESEKLGKIQVELNRLDTLLSVDVSMIRDKIEAASLEYMEAQRRYNRAEQEFINAKMALFEKGELKERLTEHLYTIIHQNEVRKANKLGELMKQLEMEVAQDDLEVGVAAIPLLTNFNSVTTLHDPTHKSPVASPETGKTVDLIHKDSNASDASQGMESVQVKSEETNNNDMKEQPGGDNSGSNKSEVPSDSSKQDSPVNDCVSQKSEASVPVSSSDLPGSSQQTVTDTAKSESSESSSGVDNSSNASANPSVQADGKS